MQLSQQPNNKKDNIILKKMKEICFAKSWEFSAWHSVLMMTPTKLAKGFRCFICLKAKAQQHNSERLIRFSNFRQHARSSWPIGPKKYQSFDSDVTNSKANHTISFSNLSCLNIVKKRMGAGAHLQINLEINLENRILDINNATPTWYLSKKCFGIIKMFWAHWIWKKLYQAI